MFYTTVERHDEALTPHPAPSLLAPLVSVSLKTYVVPPVRHLIILQCTKQLHNLSFLNLWLLKELVSVSVI